MHTIIIIYSVDTWHTQESKQPMGVFTRKAMAIGHLKKTYAITRDQATNLDLFNQTQVNCGEEPCYEGEFVLEEHPVNTLQLLFKPVLALIENSPLLVPRVAKTSLLPCK